MAPGNSTGNDPLAAGRVAVTLREAGSDGKRQTGRELGAESAHGRATRRIATTWLGIAFATLLLTAGASLRHSAGAEANFSGLAPLPPMAPAHTGAGRWGLTRGDRRRDQPRRAPLHLVSREQLLGTIQALTQIQPYSMWRTAGSEGETQARAYLRERLAALGNLIDLGMEVEEQAFRTPLGGDIWESTLRLTLRGEDLDVPADALQGHRENLDLALRFDSDGSPNDRRRDPVIRSGPVILVRSAWFLRSLPAYAVQGRVVLLDYTVVDRALIESQEAGQLAGELLARRPAAVVLLTQYSNVVGESHGSYGGDNSIFTYLSGVPSAPILLVRLEDLQAAGCAGWEDLASVSEARVAWDADVYSPGQSANLVARIPGVDRSRALILGAHLDSANSPGALDDASGCAALLEVARVLDDVRRRPPVDLLVAFFGSHERGLYGSSCFVLNHQELLDNTLAMLQVDCLTHPLDGLGAALNLETWSYRRFGDAHLPWPEYLQNLSARRGLVLTPLETNAVVSDNSSFAGHDVPNANLIYLDPLSPWDVHYVGHLHDPYDNFERALEEASTLEQMAVVALSAALGVDAATPPLRVTPPATRRAVFVASHTEPPHVSPVGFIEAGMALASRGLDVDTVPYGRLLQPGDLESAALVVALPVIDYPQSNASTYDENWLESEVSALEDYVSNGGLLVLTNSAKRLRSTRTAYESNEDWADANFPGARFGVTFTAPGTTSFSFASIVAAHPLFAGLTSLELAAGNCVPLSAPAGQVLARVGPLPAVALVRHGQGEVLALGDVGALGSALTDPPNLQFWRNLAAYALSR